MAEGSTLIIDKMGAPEEKHLGEVVVQSISNDDTHVDAKEERAFVRRLDCVFLVVGFLGYTFKYLDQTNIVRRTREKGRNR